MITGIDTNILLDLLIPDAPEKETSRTAVAAALQAGSLVISEPVYSELAAYFDQHHELERFVSETGLQIQASGRQSLHLAGKAWRSYLRRRAAGMVCARCGVNQTVLCSECGAVIQSRQHILADFLVGANALVHADQLLTRDKGYYSSYFPELTLA